MSNMKHSTNVINVKDNGSLALTPLQNRAILFGQFSSLSNEINFPDNDDDHKVNNCKYYDLEEMQSLKIPKSS